MAWEKYCDHSNRQCGLPVNVISLEELTNINKELYMSLVIDRGRKSFR